MKEIFKNTKKILDEADNNIILTPDNRNLWRIIELFNKWLPNSKEVKIKDRSESNLIHLPVGWLDRHGLKPGDIVEIFINNRANIEIRPKKKGEIEANNLTEGARP